MGKIYCITGQSRELRENVYEALLEWAERDGGISFLTPDSEESYNLYLNDYLLNVDWEEYQQFTEKFDDDILVPIYVGPDNGDPELKEFGVFKAYNVSFDDLGFNQGMKEILSSEFAYYKDDYNFREKDEVIDEALIEEEGSEDTGSVAVKKGAIVRFRDKITKTVRSIVVFLRKRKKIELAGMAAALCIVMVTAVVLSILANRPNPFYSKDNIDILGNYTNAVYIVSSNGDVYTFDGYSNCSINKTIDKQSAIVTTDYNELYYLIKGEAKKITDDVYCSYISNRGEYIYYVSQTESQTENKCVLSRYETKNGNVKDLNDFTILKEEAYCEMTTSPNGKILALNLNSGVSSEQYVYNLKGGGKISLEEVDLIYAVTDNEDIYYRDIYGKFIFAKKDGDKYIRRDISRATVEQVLFNSDYSEVFYTEYSDIGYNKCFVFTEARGTVSLPVTRILEGPGQTTDYRIKENVSATNRGISSEVYDIDTFRDMHFVDGNDSNIYQLNSDYTAKFIYGSGALYGNYSISGDGKFIISQGENKITAIDKNGNVSVLLDLGVDSTLYYFGMANNKAVYYLDRNDNSLYYKKGGQVKKICQFSDLEELSYYDGQCVVDNKKDTVYFVMNNKLYYSKGGGTPIEIVTDNMDANYSSRIVSYNSIIYYVLQMYDGTSEYMYSPQVGEIYTVTDSNELKFVLKIDYREEEQTR